MDLAIRAGTALTSILLALGLLLWLMAPEGALAKTLLDAGLFVLIATPVTRLVAALAEELRKREWRYVVLGAVVLFLLVGSYLVSRT